MSEPSGKLYIYSQKDDIPFRRSHRTKNRITSPIIRNKTINSSKTYEHQSTGGRQPLFMWTYRPYKRDINIATYIHVILIIEQLHAIYMQKS